MSAPSDIQSLIVSFDRLNHHHSYRWPASNPVFYAPSRLALKYIGQGQTWPSTDPRRRCHSVWGCWLGVSTYALLFPIIPTQNVLNLFSHWGKKIPRWRHFWGGEVLSLSELVMELSNLNLGICIHACVVRSCIIDVSYMIWLRTTASGHLFQDRRGRCRR